MTKCKKKSYDTHIEAVMKASKCLRMNGGGYLRVYYCDVCKKWHLTKMKKS